MRRCTKATCSITLPLKIEKRREDRLDKRFELGRLLHSTLYDGEKKAYRRINVSVENAVGRR